MFSTKDIWMETGYSEGKHALWSREFKENIAEGRLMNDLITNNYKVVFTDVNTVCLERVDKTRTCRWVVLSRKTPILWPYVQK